MCGRYVVKSSKQELQRAFPGVELPDELEPRFNVAPTQPVLAITSDAPSQARWLRWGLIPHWAKDAKIASKMINARADSVAHKPAYRAAFERRRCAILADGFSEWQKPARGKTRQPWLFTRKGGEPFAFAGLWEIWRPPEGGEPVVSCTVITTDANELVRTVHDRMPAMLRPDQVASWLRTDAPESESLALLAPVPADELDARPVSQAVNSAAHEGPELLAPQAQGSLL